MSERNFTPEFVNNNELNRRIYDSLATAPPELRNAVIRKYNAKTALQIRN